MKKELNTESHSLEKIWVEKEINSLHYSNNDREDWNSIASTRQFLSKAETYIKNNGFVKVRVQPIFEDDEMGDTRYIKVFGYRIETTQEYKERIGYIYQAKLRKREDVLRNVKYYSSDAYADELKQLKKLSGQ